MPMHGAHACTRAVYLGKNKRYYFESTRSPNVFWMSLADMDFAAERTARRLTLTEGAIYAGNSAAQFLPSEPFKFLEATVK